MKTMQHASNSFEYHSYARPAGIAVKAILDAADPVGWRDDNRNAGPWQVGYGQHGSAAAAAGTLAQHDVVRLCAQVAATTHPVHLPRLRPA